MNQYIHGFSETEQSRLTQMQTILNERHLVTLPKEGVHRVLDVGCGLGQLTRAIARNLPAAEAVVGIERNPLQLQEALRQAETTGESQLVEFRLGDATALPLSDFEWASFDLVHTRFLLEHVSDPLAIVRQMILATKIGGRIYLMDDDHELLRLDPACPELERVWKIYWEGYRDLGCDPLIGRRLAQLITETGANVQTVDTIFYGATYGQALFDSVVENLLSVIEGALPTLINNNRITLAEFEQAKVASEAWRSKPAATVWYSLPYAIGIRST